MAEFEEIIAQGQQKGLFNQDYSLTEKAKEEYNYIASEINLKKGLSLKSSKTKAAYYSYVPTTFRGKA